MADFAEGGFTLAGNQIRIEPHYLLIEQFGVSAGGESHDPKPIGMVGNDVQSLRADGSGRSKYSDASWTVRNIAARRHWRQPLARQQRSFATDR